MLAAKYLSRSSWGSFVSWAEVGGVWGCPGPLSAGPFHGTGPSGEGGRTGQGWPCSTLWCLRQHTPELAPAPTYPSLGGSLWWGGHSFPWVPPHLSASSADFSAKCGCCFWKNQHSIIIISHRTLSSLIIRLENTEWIKYLVFNINLIHLVNS